MSTNKERDTHFQDFGAAIKQLQSLAGHTSEQFETLRRSILAMANDRDTHFQGFAKLSYPELDHLFKLLYRAQLERDTRGIEQIEHVIKLTLAQRAYDLVYFLLATNPYNTPDELHKAIERLPDLNEWPTTAE